jgi:nucleolar protein 6
MSKSKDRVPNEDKTEKKRKRQEETEDAPKKSKKSRKSDLAQDDAPVTDAPVVEQTAALDKKAEKEEKKKRKKERKEKDAAEAVETNGAVKESEDFVPLDNDVPMPDATADKKKSKKDKKEKTEKKDKKEKKEKKEKKSKKTKDTSEEDSAPSEDAVNGAEEQVVDDAPVTNGADAESKLSKEEKKKAKKEKKDKKEKKSKKSKDDEDVVETNGDAAAAEESAEAVAQEEGDEAAEPGKKGRFIVFVGMFSSLVHIIAFIANEISKAIFPTLQQRSPSLSTSPSCTPPRFVCAHTREQRSLWAHASLNSIVLTAWRLA